MDRLGVHLGLVDLWEALSLSLYISLYIIYIYTYLPNKHRSEGFPRTGYFIPGRDGMGAWQISGVIQAAAACAFFLDLRAFPKVFGGF